MKAEPFVSIIMNCYNGEKYLKQAIDSIISQTYSNWELIFWDNQSTDSSESIFKSYNDPRFRYFRAPNRTVLYEARNYAIEKSHGEFITFLDVDDWWIPQKLTLQMALFDNAQTGVVFGNYWFFNEKKNTEKPVHKSGTLPEGKILNDLLRGHVAGLLTLIIRRAALESQPYPFDHRYHIIGDFDMIVRLATKWEFRCVQSPIAFYRWHGENETIKVKQLEIHELGIWYEEMHRDPQISAAPAFPLFRHTISYMTAMNDIGQGRLKNAVKLFGTLPMGIKKLKLFCALVLPNKLLQRVRN